MKRNFFVLAVAALALQMAPGLALVATATTETAVVVSSDLALGDDFGWDVALQGTTLVVGAPLADIDGVSGVGAVYIFEYIGGLWTQVQKLTASDGVEFDQFGFAVAISGDRLVVGAEEALIESNSSQGAAYIFERTAGVWTEVHKLVEPTTIQNFAEYGHDVAIDGDWIAVGGSKAGSAQHGRTYIYWRDQGGAGAWGLVQELQDDIYDTNAGFGTSVAMDGDLLVVGAELLDQVQGTYDNEGGAYVFQRDVSNTYNQVGKLFRTGAQNNDRAGHVVILDGSTVVMGGYAADGAGFDRGQAWVFENPTLAVDGWVQVAALEANDPQDGAYFGQSAAIFGREVWIGCEGHDVGAGKVYRFSEDEGGPANWGGTEQYTYSAPASNDLMGYSLAVDADHLAVGAFVLSGTGGAVLIYPGPGDGAPSAVVNGETPVAHLSVSAFPNPFNPSTTVAFGMDRNGEVEVLIHDLRGALVERVFRGQMDAGTHEVTWRADNVPSGVYLVTVRSGAVMKTSQVALVK